ncbi:MAG: hypothetical protein AAGF24_05695 [Cyanobacteria bacterium P01_H01_bin.121]
MQIKRIEYEAEFALNHGTFERERIRLVATTEGHVPVTEAEKLQFERSRVTVSGYGDYLPTPAESIRQHVKELRLLAMAATAAGREPIYENVEAWQGVSFVP